jgi:hypothetical protein
MSETISKENVRFKDSSLLVRCIVSSGSYSVFKGSQYLYLPGQTVLDVPFSDRLNLNVKARRSVGKSAAIYQSTGHNVPDDLNLTNIAARTSYHAMCESRLTVPDSWNNNAKQVVETPCA